MRQQKGKDDILEEPQSQNRAYQWHQQSYVQP